MANQVNHRGRRGRDRSEVMGKGKDRPAVAYSPERCILCIREFPIRGKLGSDDNVLTGLKSDTSGLTNYVSARSIAQMTLEAHVESRVIGRTLCYQVSTIRQKTSSITHVGCDR